MMSGLRENEQYAAGIAQLRSAVENVLSRKQDDERVILLRDVLLSQIQTIQLHLDLMMAESDDLLLLNESEFVEIMDAFLPLNKEIRMSISRESNSLYETEPIVGFYELLSRHFKEFEA